MNPRSSIASQHYCVRAPVPEAHHCASHASPAGTEHRQESLREIGSVGPVLDRAILLGEYANGLDLTGVTHLRDANFSGVSPQGTDFSGADLTDANLSRSDLTGADLSSATHTATDVTAATLRETRVRDQGGGRRTRPSVFFATTEQSESPL